MIELDQKLVERLEKIGLSDKESKIYAALLLTGGAYPSTIAEITKLNRTTIYKILSTLAVRGLVIELEKRNKLYYYVENPVSIERFAQSQITLANRRLENAHSILPTLLGLYAHSDNKPIVKFFEGRDGVLRIYEDHVAGDDKCEQLAFSNTADLVEFLPKDFVMRYIKQKEKLGITTRVILPDQDIDLKYDEIIYERFPKKIWPELKHIPRSMFPYKSDVTIYGKNKVSIINFSEPQFSGTIIEDKTIHDMMVMVFELAWKGADLF